MRLSGDRHSTDGHYKVIATGVLSPNCDFCVEMFGSMADRMKEDTPKKMFESAESAKEAIGLAIGAASMCWEHPEKAGIFQSERASKIVDELIDYLYSNPIR